MRTIARARITPDNGLKPIVFVPIALALAVAAAAIGCAPTGPSGPSLTGLSVSPATLDYAGGAVTATVTLVGGDATVTLRGQARYDGGASADFTLDAQGAGRYAGQVTIAGNTTTTDADVQVAVQVVRAGTGEVVASATSSVTVTAAGSHPPAPPEI